MNPLFSSASEETMMRIDSTAIAFELANSLENRLLVL